MIFVDTGAWYALADENDRLHRQAATFIKDLGDGQFGKLVTSDYVLDESFTMLRLRLGTGPVQELAELAEGSPSLEVIWIAESDFRAALSLLLSREDKRWSFTDCTSFALMEALGIRDAFTFDSNFKEAGFTMHP